MLPWYVMLDPQNGNWIISCLAVLRQRNEIDLSWMGASLRALCVNSTKELAELMMCTPPSTNDLNSV